MLDTNFWSLKTVGLENGLLELDYNRTMEKEILEKGILHYIDVCV